MKSLICVLCLIPTISWGSFPTCERKISAEESLYMQLREVMHPTKALDGEINIELYKELIKNGAFPVEKVQEQEHHYNTFKVETFSVMGGMMTGQSQKMGDVQIVKYKDSPEALEAKKKSLLEAMAKADRAFSYQDNPARLYLSNKDGSGMTIDFRYPLSANPIARHENEGKLRYVYVDPTREIDGGYEAKPNYILDQVLKGSEFYSYECDEQVIAGRKNGKVYTDHCAGSDSSKDVKKTSEK